jgi:hypothetical protein
MRSYWGPTLLLAGILACGSAEPIQAPEPASPAAEAAVPGPAKVPEGETETETRDEIEAETETKPQAVQQVPEVPAAPVRPLADLLRLPASPGRVDRSAERLKTPEPETDPASEPKRKESRVGVDLQTRTDGSTAQPSKSRTQTDAGVSVGVGETTKVRGGVRVEQEAGKEREDPVPTVGIERRF